MTAWAPTSETLWDALAAANTGSGEVATLPLQQGRGGNPAYIGLTKDGLRCLLIPLLENEEPGIAIKTKSIVSGLRVLSGPSGVARYLEIRCIERALNIRFGVIADDIAHAVAIEERLHPTSAVSAVLARWRLLITGSQRRLSEPELIGLWGELHVLGQLNALNPKAVELWRGPFGEIHDFRGSSQLIEVKAGIYSSADSIIVNGVEQLEDPVDGRLILARVRLEKDGNGKSVGDLFGFVAETWAPSEATETALAEHGVSKSALLAYEDSRYSIREMSLYTVGAGFPRITRKSFADGTVPVGTSTLRYEVDLSLAQPFRIPQSMTLATLKEVVDA